MAIFEIKEGSIVEVPKTTFKEQNILERQHLQNYLRDKIEILSPDTLIISEEFSDWDESRKRIDLLGLDSEANLIVIELKRNDSGDHMELQALRYASMISTMTFSNCVNIFQKHLDKKGINKNAKDEILEFLDWNELEDDFGNDVKIILASQDFSKELTTSVTWLNERNLDIKCIKLEPYKHDGKVLLEVSQIIPIPEIESYQIKIREKSTERRNAQSSSRDRSQYLFNGQSYGKGKLVLAVVTDYVMNNPEISFSELQEAFPKQLQGSHGVFSTLEFVEEKFKHRPRKRHFLKDQEIIHLKEEAIVICTQWGIDKLTKFLDRADELGIKIEKILN